MGFTLLNAGPVSSQLQRTSLIYYAIVKYTNLSQSCSTQVSERSGYQISFRAIEKLPNRKRFNFQGNENRQLIGPSLCSKQMFLSQIF